MNTHHPILEVKDLRITFYAYQKGMKKKITGVSQLYATLKAGEILTVAGASGAGKSLLASALLGILPTHAKVEGSLIFKGETLTAKRIRTLRGKEIAYIPQSISALDPLMRVGTQMGKVALALLPRYGLDKEIEGMYPHQLSGGMARRVLIACAAGSDASLIVADEPTAGLNEELAHEIMKHLRELANEGRSILLITHDLSLAAPYSNQVAIIENGRTIEVLRAEDLMVGKACHPFTRLLWDSLPENQFMKAGRRDEN